MKTIVKQFATGAFIAFLFLVGNVNAKGTETKASSRENLEAPIQLANWMTDETIWNANEVNMSEFAMETEATLELEDWMTNTNLWDLNSGFVEEVETNLKIYGNNLGDNIRPEFRPILKNCDKLPNLYFHFEIVTED